MSASVRAAAAAGVGLLLASGLLVGGKIVVTEIQTQTTADMAALAAARPVALSYMNTGSTIPGPTGCEIAARVSKTDHRQLVSCLPHPGASASAVGNTGTLGPIRGAGVRVVVQSQLDIPGWGTQVITRKAHAIVP